MEEWKEYKLAEVCTKITDGSHSSPKAQESGYPMFSVKDMLEYGFDYSKCKYISQEDYVILKKNGCVPQKGDVLVAKDGSYLKQIFVCKETKEEAILSSIAIFRPNSLVDSFFLSYLLKSPQVYNYIANNCVSGSALPRIVLKDFKEVNLPIPSIEIQKSIVSILKSLDDKIEVNRRINENLEQQAQALFKSWLNSCEDEVTIGDLSLNITDYTKCEQKQVVLINSSDVTEGRFEHHNLSENKNLKGHFKKRFQKGDILYSQVRPRNRHWGYCTFNAENYLASTQLMVIRNRPDVISSILLYQYIIEDNVWMDFTLRTETRSGTFPQGNYEDLSAIKVPFGADVKEITDNLENIYSLIYKNEQESRRLAELRDTLLPKLMSGELKVNELNI